MIYSPEVQYVVHIISASLFDLEERFSRTQEKKIYRTNQIKNTHMVIIIISLHFEKFYNEINCTHGKQITKIAR